MYLAFKTNKAFKFNVVFSEKNSLRGRKNECE